MLVEIENNKKVNFKLLQIELGEPFKIVQEAYTKTIEDNQVEFFPTIINIEPKSKTESEVIAIIQAHAPELTEREEELENRELPEWMLKKIRLLIVQVISEEKGKK